MTRNDPRNISDAVGLMFRPAAGYSARVAASREGSWRAALAVPGLLALLLGIVTSMATTGRVVALLILSQTICWSFVPALQVGAGAILIASAPGRPVTFSRAMELLFGAHGPWSLWLVIIAALEMTGPNQNLVLASAAAPSLWTALLVYVFSREVLGLTSAQARVRVVGQQAATVLLILLYMDLGSRLSVRLIGLLDG